MFSLQGEIVNSKYKKCKITPNLNQGQNWDIRKFPSTLPEQLIEQFHNSENYYQQWKANHKPGKGKCMNHCFKWPDSVKMDSDISVIFAEINIQYIKYI